MTPPNLKFALAYAKKGMRVFPIQEGTKLPACAHGVLDATTDVDKITHWWEKENHNIAIACGHGLLVIDTEAEFDKSHLKHPFQTTKVSRTGGGGIHYWYWLPMGVTFKGKGRIKILPNMDLRSDGDYVLAPPSVTDKGSYSWIGDPTDKVADIPKDLMIELQDLQNEKNHKPVHVGNNGKMAAGVCEGERNATLTSLLGTNLKRGIQGDALRKIAYALNETFSPPMDEYEVDQVLNSVSRYPAGELKPVKVVVPSEPVKYKPFPVDSLPDVLKAFVVGQSQVQHSDPAFCALPLLAAVGTVIGTTRAVSEVNWQEYPVVWAAIVGSSGAGKSPAFNAATSPLKKIEIQVQEEYQDVKECHDHEMLKYEAELSKWKNKKDDTPAPKKPPRLRRPSIMTTNSTVETLGDILDNNPRGVAVVADELAAWVNGFDAYKTTKLMEGGFLHSRENRNVSGRSFVVYDVAE